MQHSRQASASPRISAAVVAVDTVIMEAALNPRFNSSSVMRSRISPHDAPARGMSIPTSDLDLGHLEPYAGLPRGVDDALAEALPSCARRS